MKTRKIQRKDETPRAVESTDIVAAEIWILGDQVECANASFRGGWEYEGALLQVNAVGE